MSFLKSLIISAAILSIASALDFEWMYLHKYGSDVVLKPLKPLEDTYNTIDTCHWIDPEGKKLNSAEADTSKYEIDDATCHLTLKNIQKNSNGIYHSVINNQFYSKAMLNYHGPPAESAIEEYRWNLLAGFLTGFGMFACIIYFHNFVNYAISNRNNNFYFFQEFS